MTELPFEYLNKVASQVIVISSLLSGFSIAMIANLLINEKSTRILNLIFKTTIITASSFLITVFSMTNIILKTTEGYPEQLASKTLDFPRIIGFISFFVGLISLSILISLSGWTKSKKMGIFTTIVGVLTFFLIIMNT